MREFLPLMKILSTSGSNAKGQLGLGDTDDRCEFEQVNIGGNVVAAACGANHTVVLLDDGSVWGCGSNEMGELGIIESLENKQIVGLRRLCLGISDKVVSVHCAWETTFLITESGGVLSTGSNSFGQAGHGTLKTLNTFQEIKGLPPVSKIASGGRHTLLIAKDDDSLWGCGSNRFGQLAVAIDSRPLDMTMIPSFPAVEAISCGLHHSAVITKADARILVFGRNRHGQLGHLPTEYPYSAEPLILEVDSSHIPTEIYCGWSATAILTSGGTVFMCGSNKHGQLGGESSELAEKCPQESMQLSNNIFWKLVAVNTGKIKELSVGSEHSIAVDETNRILCWGWNEHGNCGLGHQEDVKRVSVIEKPKNALPVMITAGTGHSLLLLSDTTHIE